jgi:F-type H+-transporting ATPase subunit epsilon
MSMNLKLSVPTEVLFNQPVTKIVADGTHGCFCLLPRHTDFLTALLPGIMIISDANGHESFFANDHGLLVKRGRDVFVVARRAIQGSDLGTLRATVHQQFESLDEADRVCQSAIASLEANFLRRFLEMQRELL